MSKKPLSDMTSSDFVRITGALSGVQKHMAEALGKSVATISSYACGRQPIPVDVVERLRVLIQERIKECSRMGHAITQRTQDEAVSNLIVVTNEAKRKIPDRAPRLLRREKPEDSRVYPTYRLSPDRFELFAKALGVYHAACVEHRRQATDPRDIKAYDRELADLRVIAGNTKGVASKGAPYNMYITFSEWFVVSRALRHAGPDVYFIYQHWRHHKGSGYPA